MTEALAHRIRAVKENLRQIPNKGAGYLLLKHMGSPEVREKVAMQREPEISFNYMSSFDGEINTELFEKSDLAMGPYIDPQSNRRFKLDINVYLIDGCLSVEIEYNKKQYHQETIQRLGTEFENQLKDIVKHCSESGQNTIHTPSDFGARDLSINDFDEIMNMLDQ